MPAASAQCQVAPAGRVPGDNAACPGLRNADCDPVSKAISAGSINPVHICSACSCNPARTRAACALGSCCMRALISRQGAWGCTGRGAEPTDCSSARGKGGGSRGGSAKRVMGVGKGTGGGSEGVHRRGWWDSSSESGGTTSQYRFLYLESFQSPLVLQLHAATLQSLEPQK